jgi:ATP synthase protein I
MQTTETRTAPSVVSRAAVASVVTAVAVTVVGGIAAGSSGAAGAAVGGVIAVAVFAFGAFAVDAVARLMPAASLLFALVTYTFQVAAMALVFVALNTSGLLDDGTLDSTWVGIAIIAGAFVWMAVQIRMATTARIPAFEPRPEQAPAAGSQERPDEASADASEAGAR